MTDKLIIENAPNCLICIEPKDLLISYKNKSADNLFCQLNISPVYFTDIFETSENDKILDFIFNDEKIHDNSADIDCRLRSQKDLWVNIRLSKVNDTYIFCLVDVTRNRKQLWQIEASEALLNQAQAISKIGSFNIDLVNHEIYRSLEAYKIFRLDPTKKPLEKEDFLNIIHPADLSKVKDQMQKTFEKGGKYLLDYRIIAPDGKTRYIFEEGEGVLDEKGMVIRVHGFYEDTTDLREIRNSLHIEKERLHQVLSNIEEVFYFVRITGPAPTDRKLEFISPKCERLYGHTAEELYHDITILFARSHPDDISILKNGFLEMDTEKKPVSFVFRYNPFNTNIYIWLEKSITPTLDVNNKVIGYYGTSRNITTRKEQEDKIVASEKRLRTADSIAKLGHWDWNISTNELFWSDEIFRIFGIPKEQIEISYTKFLSFVHPQDVSLVENAVTRSINKGIPYSIQHRIVTPANEIKHVWERGELVRESNDQPLKMVGTVQDITDIKLLEEELYAKDQQYRYFFENSLVGTFHASYKEERVIQANEKTVSLFGYSSREELVDNFYKTAHFAEQDGRERFRNELISNHRLVRNIQFKKKSGEPFWVQAFVKAELEKGELEAIFIDITKQVEYEEELRRSNNEKDLLLKEIHHRVKNNLQIIIGLIEMNSMQQKPDTKMTISRIKSIAQIHDLLYKSPVLGKIDIKAYIENFISEFNISYSEINIAFAFEVSTCHISIEQAIPLGIMLNEVIMNIYKHAFDKKSAGKVSIKLFEDDDIVFFEINDNGKGLPKDFNYKESKSLGFTLMIALAKQIRGKLNVKSVNGTTFQLIFKRI